MHHHRALKHGSPYARAILVRELASHRRAARQSLRLLRDDPALTATVTKLNEWMASCATWADSHPRPEIVKRNTPTPWRTAWEIARLYRCGVRADRIIETVAAVVLYFGDPPASQKWRRYTVARHVLNLSPHFVSPEGGNSVRLSSAVLDWLGAYLINLVNPLMPRLSAEVLQK